MSTDTYDPWQWSNTTPCAPGFESHQLETALMLEAASVVAEAERICRDAVDGSES